MAPVCSQCNQEKQVNPKGRLICYPCKAKKQREYDASHLAEKKARAQKYSIENREEILAGKRIYYEQNWARIVLYQARLRAVRKGVPFSLTEADVQIPEKCPVFGIVLRPSTGKPTDASPTIDRIVPERGYVPGNIRVISGRANRIKSDGTVEEHERIAAWMKEQTYG